MIMKFLRAFGTGDRGIRTVWEFFDLMLKRAVERVDNEKLTEAKQDPNLRRYRESML